VFLCKAGKKISDMTIEFKTSKQLYRKIWDSKEWKIKRELLLIKVGHKCQWCINTTYLQMAHISECTWVDLTDEEYLTTDQVLILCRKCHYAKKHGKVKCPCCEGYKSNNKFNTCWKCNNK